MRHTTLACLILALALAVTADARDRGQVRIFRKNNPCPATGKTAGPCRGWVVDHVVPICLGGADAPVNMQWQPYGESLDKDKEERRACALRRRAVSGDQR